MRSNLGVMVRPAKNRATVLIAEDDLALRKMIERLLQEVADVVACADGHAALQTLLSMERKPDLVVTDLMMPGVDGLSLVKRMKEDPKLERVPVIMLTAKGTPRDVVDGINAGARHYLTKPFKHEALLAKVKHVLRIDD